MFIYLLSSGILLPGVTAFMILVVTVCVKREDGQFVAQSQCQLVLRDMVNLFKKKSYTLSFSKAITVSPSVVVTVITISIVNIISDYPTIICDLCLVNFSGCHKI